jgi:membrane protein YqaA with SNARE-associated domain
MAISSRTKHILRIVFVAIAVVVAIWLNTQFASEGALLSHIRSFGYIGLFFVSVVSGFNVLVPIPIIAFFPTLVAAGFDPYLAVGVISIGMTVGDGLGYLIGSTAQESTFAEHVAEKTKALKEKHPLVLPFWIFVYGAVVPLPNELIVIPLAALRVPFYIIFVPLAIGNILFNTLIATGVVGIVHVL